MPSEPPIDPETARAIGRVLRTARDRVGLSQEEVAHQAGMNRNHYQLLESGLSDRAKKTPANPRLSTLIALSRIYRTDVTVMVADVFRRGPAVEYRPNDRASPSGDV